ncbi:MAG: ABC transporter permease subunit [Finegoldia sp.]|nr:ABC transporter permease subunit [Finegoldia sp.]
MTENNNLQADSNMQVLTAQEIFEMEAKPKTKKDIVIDYIISFLPIVAGIISLLEYYFVPNFDGKKNTHVYGIFMLILTAIPLVMFVISFFNKNVHRKLRKIAPFYAFVLILLTLYDLATLKTNKLIMPYFPWVDHVFNSALSDAALLIESLVSSIKLLAEGYIIGVVLGVITGILCGYSDKVAYWIQPFLKLIGPIPTTTWLPVVMVIAASLHGAAIFVIVIGVWFSVSLATITGIRSIDEAYYEAAQTLGAKGGELVYRIAIPCALPNIFQGMIQGMSLACNSLLVAEMLGVDSGLGWYINWQRGWAEFSKMYAAIVIICLLFFTVNKILKVASDKLLVWKEGRI